MPGSKEFEAFRKWLIRLPCTICGGATLHNDVQEWFCDPAHVKTKATTPMYVGNVIPLCRVHHHEQHGMGVKRFQSLYGKDLKKIAEKLGEEFMAQWKHAERRVASALGGKRNTRGQNFGVVMSDIEHSWISAEVKYRKEIPSYIRDWLNQAKGYDTFKRKLPIVVMMEKGASWKNGVVMLTLGDFKEWFGGFKKKEV